MAHSMKLEQYGGVTKGVNVRVQQVKGYTAG